MSKGLKALERIVMPDELFTKECKRLNIDNHSDYEYLKKEIKAFEFIKNKRVDIKLVLWAGDNVEAYNAHVRETKDYWPRLELTEEEFKLLKEVLVND